MNLKVALVTGAASRTGAVIAEDLARHGYQVAVHANSSRAEADATVDRIRRAGGEANTFIADLSQPRAAHSLIDSVFTNFGRLDLLVNNASVFWQDHLWDFDEERLDEAWAVNCRAPILLTRALYDKAKQAQVQAVVINVVDQKVKNNFHPDHFSYTLGKASIGSMTTMLAMSAQPFLRVNAVFPGLMLPSDTQSKEDFSYASKKSNLLGRVAGPKDIADAIRLLASPAYNGTDFVVDSGQNLIPVAQDVLYLHKAPRT